MSDISKEEHCKYMKEVKANAIISALGFMERDQVFAYLSNQAISNDPNDLIDIIERIAWLFGNEELKIKLDPVDLIKKTIVTAKANTILFAKTEVWAMVALSAKLLSRYIGKSYHFGCSQAIVVTWGVSLFNHFSAKTEADRVLARELLNACGGHIGKKGLQAVFADLSTLVEDEEKRKDAYNYLAEGYLEHNRVYYMALTALWGDKDLSGVNSRTPSTEILEALKGALEIFDADNRDSVNKAKALFWQACRFPGIDRAKAVVMEVRPDLIGELA